MKYLFILIAFILTFNAWSQDVYSRNYAVREADFYYNKHIKLGANDVDYTLKSIGSPYAYPEFLPGALLTSDSVIHKNIYLRYNVHRNEMEVKTSKTEDVDVFSLLKSPDFYVKIKEKVYEFVPLNGKVEDGTYFEILYSGDHVDLYKNQTKKYSPPVKARTSLQGDIPQKFEDVNKYYIVTDEGLLYEIPSSKRAKLDVFNVKKEYLEKYVKKNRLNLGDEKDLLRLISHYDSLL
tara:strand:+ start:7871 stop:8578 length:708 start_codon:yes stop_codon:yes gene_type:complete